MTGLIGTNPEIIAAIICISIGIGVFGGLAVRELVAEILERLEARGKRENKEKTRRDKAGA